MSIMRYLYLFAAVAAVVLAFTANFWLPTKWLDRVIRKHKTPSADGSFPFYWAGSDAPGKAAQQQQQQHDRPSGSSPAKKATNPEDIAQFPFELGATKVYSKPEVAEHNGAADPSKPLLLVILGEVFDVTTGERFYGVDKGYNGFVGKDNTAAFHTGKFSETQEDIRELGPSAVQGIVGWRSFFRTHETYKFVGVLEGLYFDSNGQPTAALETVNRIAAGAKAGEAEDQRRAKLQPRCNMFYDGIKKETAVWCDPYNSDQALANADKDENLRVLRMVKFTSQATGEGQQDCRCLRLKTGEADIGSAPFPTAVVERYLPEKCGEKDSPRCFFKTQ